MGTAQGHVTMNDLPTKTKLHRFCEKKIDQWIQTKISQSTEDSPIQFRVEFSEDPDTQKVSCLTEVVLGSETFRGCELATDSQQAFMQTLKRLQVKY
jgi:hypothetical protein